MSDDDAFARKLAELGATFRQQLPARLAELRRLAEEGRVDDLRAIAHQIAGRGGTFGAPEVTAAARGVEEAPNAEVAAAIDGLALAIERCR